MTYLDNQVMGKRGDRHCLASISEDTGETELVAITWIDRNRRFFVSTCYGLEEGEEIFRERYRQTSEDPEADPEKVAIQVSQPKAVEVYYDGAGVIDQHNKMRAAELRIDRNLSTKEWSRGVNLGIFGICIVDGYYLYNQVVHER